MALLGPAARKGAIRPNLEAVPCWADVGVKLIQVRLQHKASAVPKNTSENERWGQVAPLGRSWSQVGPRAEVGALLAEINPKLRHVRSACGRVWDNLQNVAINDHSPVHFLGTVPGRTWASLTHLPGCFLS